MSLALLAAPFTGLVLPCAATAQTGDAVGERPDPAPAWLARWRPLETLGDLTRTLPATEHAFPDVLTRPAPRIGHLWTVGNPAALALEVDDRRVDFSLGYADDSGDYRRPLDPGSRSGARLAGIGWRPVGDGAVLGSVIVERGALEEGNHANILAPYAGSPFVVLDTIGDNQNRTLARIEGAGGWRLGPVAAGLGLGYESQDTQTQRTNVPRVNRTATPGVTLGLAWAAEDGGPAVGFHGRWQRTVENMTAVAIAAASRFYAPDGYTEPVAFDLNNAVFQRRYERGAWSAGLSFGGSLRAAGRWIVYGQREWRSEDRFSSGAIDPLTDTWDADGWTIGAAAASELGALSAALDARFTTLDGEGFRGDVELLNFRGSEDRLALEADLRWRTSDAVTLAARLGLTRESRRRDDLIEQVGTDISAWVPSAAVETALQLGRRLALSIGGSAVHHGPTGATPDPDQVGPAYAKWIAPGPGLHATRATGGAGRVTLRWSAGGTTDVWLRAQLRTASPDTSGPQLPDSPSGDRTGWLAMVGATLRP